MDRNKGVLNAEYVKATRNKYNLTQKQLANLIGFSKQQRVSEIESGRVKISRGIKASLLLLNLLDEETVNKIK